MNTVRAPETCPTCDGEGYVFDHGWDNEWTPGVPCPDCSVCEECGDHEPSGLLCDACREAEDWVDDDYRHKVNEGSR